MATQSAKAKRSETPGTTSGTRVSASARKPSVARAEVIDKATRARFETELDAALKRRPTNEAKIAGALRAVAALSPALRGALAEAAQVMVRRGSYGREIYGACLRTLAEAEDRSVPALLKLALAAEDAGGSATLSAACFCKDPSLAATLAKLASSRQSHLAFGAETARVCRRESNGAHLASLAPMIKESHRIALCAELFVPLARSAPIPVCIGPGLNVLRGAERHLGRWLVLADVAAKAGDTSPLEEATAKAQIGPASSRAAWSLVAWALQETRANGAAQGVSAAAPMNVTTNGAGVALGGSSRLGAQGPAGADMLRGPASSFSTHPGQHAPHAEPSAISASAEHLPRAPLPLPPAAPTTRPTVELVARLSDRPSADRDTTFLFRMARARAATCKPMLDGIVRGPNPVAGAPLTDEVAVRAASYLARDHERPDLTAAILECARTAKRDELRGFAVAALWDTGDAEARATARELADELLASRCITSVAWGALVRAAHSGAIGKNDPNFVVAGETPFRWVQWGWLE